MMRKWLPSSWLSKRFTLFRNELGFTAIESVTVLAIISGGMLVAGYSMRSNMTKAQQKLLDANLVGLAANLHTFNTMKAADPNAIVPPDSELATSTKDFIKKIDDLRKQASSLALTEQQREVFDQARKLSDALNTCSITQPLSVQATVGKKDNGVHVTATIPLDQTESGTISSTDPPGGSAPIRKDRGFVWEGTIVLNGEKMKAGNTSQLSVTVTSSKDPSIALTCGNVVSVTWVRPPSPEIKSFNAKPTEILPGQSSTLSYQIINAASATIAPSGFTLGKSGNEIAGKIPVSPSQTTTYTLTATTPGADPETATQTATVTVKTPPTGVTITAPAANAQITADQVTVTGLVAPVPPAEFRTAQIRVNGTPQASAIINASGQFSASVPLTKKTTKDKLQITGLSDAAASCTESISQDLYVTNTATKDEVKNTITVVVKLADNPPPPASVVVSHAVEFLGYFLSWDKPSDAACEKESESQSLTIPVPPGGGPVKVATVTFGKVSKSCSVSPTVISGVTGIALPQISATWAFGC